METLNLDALADTKRSITLNGVTYQIEEMTVDNFIETTRVAERLERNGEASMVDEIEATVGVIQRSIPQMPVDKLRALPLKSLILVSKFIRGELPADFAQPKAEAEGDAAEGGEKK